jgi:uncharacterized lipoprotein YddW (UPF0748 family)
MTLNRRSLAFVAGLSAIVGCASLAEAQTYRSTRPVRGAWLRPPSVLTGSGSLDETLQSLAAAGITDLFLETFYWGVSTGKQGVFNARFGFDYLQSAIIMSARYGIRVHAWCESGYWQYGSTGGYNFTVNAPGQSEGNPEWKAISSATGAGGGDGTSGQVFANLCHPGVQAKMRAYFTELAGYKGIWGIQTDYHRFALDDNTGDSNPAPWSFDTYSRNTFMALGNADPLTNAITTSGSEYTDFLNWRKAGVTEAARQMELGIDSVDTGIEFSAAMFANPETTKCQDWRTWATNGYIDWLMPMAYGSTSNSIRNDLNTVKAGAAGRRVIAGLYIDSTSGHPTLATQLTAANSATGTTGTGVQDWVFFSGGTFNVPANQTTLYSYITTTAQKQRGDFNDDGYIGSADWAAFRAVYNGTPVSSAGANARYNYNGDSQITESDWILFKREFARWHFGEASVVGQRQFDAFLQCMNALQGNNTTRKHLYDFDGNGIVNYNDQLYFHQLLTVNIGNDNDVNKDGKIELDDLYKQNQNPIDVNRDGVINAADTASLEATLRVGELEDMSSGRR